jgi:membrane associated rhomboid family serine protease
MAFVVLGLFIALQGLNLFYIVTIGVALASGIGIWLFGTDTSVHAGASGVIYGYIGFLFVYGLVSRNPLALIFGLVAFFAYGRVVVGILPSGPGISWEGHFFGFFGGIVMAYIVAYVQTSCCP